MNVFNPKSYLTGEQLYLDTDIGICSGFFFCFFFLIEIKKYKYYQNTKCAFPIKCIYRGKYWLLHDDQLYIELCGSEISPWWVELVNCKVKSSKTLTFGFGLFFFFACLSLLKQVTSLSGYLKYCHKALPTLVFLPGLTWLYNADRRLHYRSSQGSEHRHAGGEYGNARCPCPLRAHAC